MATPRVTYKQAVALKELGIVPEKIDWQYDRKKMLYEYQPWNFYDDCPNKLKISDYPAPTVSEALQMLRDKLQDRAVFEIRPSTYKPVQYSYVIYQYISIVWAFVPDIYSCMFDSYIEVENELLNSLIRLVKTWILQEKSKKNF